MSRFSRFLCAILPSIYLVYITNCFTANLFIQICFSKFLEPASQRSSRDASPIPYQQVDALEGQFSPQGKGTLSIG